jgi:hypothetical protein
MTFTIPRPDWVSDALIEERGQFAGFQMYTTEGNNAVGSVLTDILRDVERTGALPRVMKDAVKQAVRNISKTHPEVHDTEPEWAIVDAVNAFCDTVGFRHIDRDDI